MRKLLMTFGKIAVELITDGEGEKTQRHEDMRGLHLQYEARRMLSL